MISIFWHSCAMCCPLSTPQSNYKQQGDTPNIYKSVQVCGHFVNNICICSCNLFHHVFSPSFVVVNGLKLFDVAGTAQLVPLLCNQQSVLVQADVDVVGWTGGNVVVVVRAALSFFKRTNPLNPFSMLLKGFLV